MISLSIAVHAFQQSCQYFYMDAPHGCLQNIRSKSLTAITQGCCKLYWTSPRGNTPQNSSCTATYHSSQNVPQLVEPDMRNTAREVRTKSYAMYSCGPLHMDEQRLDDQLEPIYNSSVLIQDVAWKTSQEQWTIETGGERGSGKSMLAVWHDDNDDFLWLIVQSFHISDFVFYFW